MAISKDKIQITAVISKEICDLLDEQAENEIRTRSQLVSKIIIDYYKNQKLSEEKFIINIDNT